MRKLGFALRTLKQIDRINAILSNSDSHCSGLWVEDSNLETESLEYNLFKNIDELIANSDILIIDSTNDLKFEIASKAIKKGVTPILSNVYGASNSTLNKLQQLALEMGIIIGIDQLGVNYSDVIVPIDIPFIAHFKRYISDETISYHTFKRTLLFDLASALKVSKLDIRKVRAYSIPLYASEPSNLMVLIDFSNNSVITYTLQTNSENNGLDIEVCTSENEQNFKCTYKDSIHDLSGEIAFTNLSLFNKIKTSGNIDLAIATKQVADTVLSKIKQ